MINHIHVTFYLITYSFSLNKFTCSTFYYFQVAPIWWFLPGKEINYLTNLSSKEMIFVYQNLLSFNIKIFYFINFCVDEILFWNVFFVGLAFYGPLAFHNFHLQPDKHCDWQVWTLEKGIPRGIIGLNHLSKFVCTQWAVWLMYSSSWILVGWKFYSLINNNASSAFTNLYNVKFWDYNSISYFF